MQVDVDARTASVNLRFQDAKGEDRPAWATVLVTVEEGSPQPLHFYVSARGTSRLRLAEFPVGAATFQIPGQDARVRVDLAPGDDREVVLEVDGS